MGKMTFVVEYEDGKEPPINAGLEIFGGRVISAAFYNYRDKELTSDEADAVLDAINHYDLKESCEEFSANYDNVLTKLKSLT